MSNADIFGPLWSATQAERAVLAQLQEWLSTYLSVVEDNEPNLVRGDISRPRSWQADIDVTKLPETQVPAIIVVVGDEVVDRDGNWLHSFISLDVGVIVRGASRAQARDVARQYTAAIKGALLHRPDVHDTFAHLTYNGAAYGELAGDAGVVAATATISFTALVGNTLNLNGGPLGPPLPTPPDVPTWPDYPPFPIVDETIVTVTPEEHIP